MYPIGSPDGSTRSRFLRPPARVAIAGDWHANTEYGIEAIRHAHRRRADVLIHLGDFGFHFTDHYLDRLESALSACDLVLGFVDGNHEDFDRLLAFPVAPDGLRYLRERIIHLPRGFRWTWKDTHCLAVGGAHSIDSFLRTSGSTWWPQEAITDTEVRDITAAGAADVMFCHDCPSGIAVPGMERDRYGFPDDEIAESERGRARLRRIVDEVRPQRLWHGHFHHRYQAVLDGGHYRTVIDGLGRDKDPIDNNLVVVDLAHLGRHEAARPHLPEHHRPATPAA